MKKILVIGATGPQGRPVAQKLAAAGYEVTALVRDPARAAGLADIGVRLAAGDLEDAAAVKAAMVGQDGVFLLISFFAGRAAQAETVIAAAMDQGVRRIVWNATGPILPFDTGNPSIDMRRGILAALEASGISFVALQPTVYMENFLIPAIAQEVATADVLAYPMPEAVRCQWISHLDAASYAVAAFADPDPETLVIEIAGPEKLSGSEIAERFGRALGRQITFRPMPPEEFARAISFDGNEEAIIGYYRGIFESPDMMTTHVDHEAALARLPIRPVSIQDFATIHRDLLTAG
ncbi:SDR family oxidoreductase [Tistrella mobilis]|uniref:NmrA family protein n=1 Tax=Tistrella mobilis (strain KA081020-065) TaxID=1110502 RepID=I3TVF9_TISMK|nr:NmrA family NAD(P)-binding protein [Tistrella mobilis]AFK56747.1 NmrA family protein [Tistrella mobilis KA081020-065]